MNHRSRVANALSNTGALCWYCSVVLGPNSCSGQWGTTVSFQPASRSCCTQITVAAACLFHVHVKPGPLASAPGLWGLAWVEQLPFLGVLQFTPMYLRSMCHAASGGANVTTGKAGTLVVAH